MSAISLAGKVAIVTGAGSGLGRAHALALARHGASVVINDLDPDAARKVADEINSAGGRALGHGASVTDFAAMQAMVAGVMDSWGRLDILINNAGILRDRTFAKMSLDDFRLVLDIHLMGAVNCTKAVWEIMRAQKFGRVVMTTSSTGLWGNFGQSNYGAAKMGLVGLMLTLGLEGERYDIRVNALAPTAITGMTEGILSDDEASAFDPAAVSPGVVFLASDEAPSRVILCAGAGSYECAQITVTRGMYVGTDSAAADRLAAAFPGIADRDSEQVYVDGAGQRAHELDARRSARGTINVDRA